MTNAEELKELISTAFDALSMLAVAVGVGWGLWAHVGSWSLVVAGVLLAVLTGVSSWLRRPKVIPESEVADPAEVQPGPTHPGTLHVIGR